MSDLAYDSAFTTLREEETNRRVLKMELRKLMKAPDRDDEDVEPYESDIKEIEARITVLKEWVKQETKEDNG